MERRNCATYASTMQSSAYLFRQRTMSLLRKSGSPVGARGGEGGAGCVDLRARLASGAPLVDARDGREAAARAATAAVSVAVAAVVATAAADALTSEAARLTCSSHWNGGAREAG